MLMCSCIRILENKKKLLRKAEMEKQPCKHVRHDSFIIDIFMSMETDHNM